MPKHVLFVLCSISAASDGDVDPAIVHEQSVVPLGETIRLKGHVSPTASLCCLKDGTSIEDHPRLAVIGDDELVITNATASDGGFYQCGTSCTDLTSSVYSLYRYVLVPRALINLFIYIVSVYYINFVVMQT